MPIMPLCCCLFSPSVMYHVSHPKCVCVYGEKKTEPEKEAPTMPSSLWRDRKRVKKMEPWGPCTIWGRWCIIWSGNSAGYSHYVLGIYARLCVCAQRTLSICICICVLSLYVCSRELLELTSQYGIELDLVRSHEHLYLTRIVLGNISSFSNILTPAFTLYLQLLAPVRILHGVKCERRA